MDVWVDLYIISMKTHGSFNCNFELSTGLFRFLIGKFPAVVNKLVPPNLDESQITQLLTEDPEYFNDLTYDAVADVVCLLLVELSMSLL